MNGVSSETVGDAVVVVRSGCRVVEAVSCMNRLLIVVSVLCVTPLAAYAQVLGLPVVEAPSLESGKGLIFDGGVVVEDDRTLFGGRVGVPFSSSTRLFVSGGILTLDQIDTDGPVVGVSALHQFDAAAPVAVGMRTAFDYATLEGSDDDIAADWEADIWTLSVLAVIGGRSDASPVEWYANIGIVHTNGEFEFSSDLLDDSIGFEGDGNTEIQLGGGFSYAVGSGVKMFAALDLVDDLFLSAGVRMGL